MLLLFPIFHPRTCYVCFLWSDWVTAHANAELSLRVRSETLCRVCTLCWRHPTSVPSYIASPPSRPTTSMSETGIRLVCEPMPGRNPAQKMDAFYHINTWKSLSGNWQLASRGRCSHVTWLKRAACGRGSVRWASKIPCPNVTKLHDHSHTCFIPPTRVRQVAHFPLRIALMGLPRRHGTLGYLRRATTAVDDKHREPRHCCRSTREIKRGRKWAEIDIQCRALVLAGVGCLTHESGGLGTHRLCNLAHLNCSTMGPGFQSSNQVIG